MRTSPTTESRPPLPSHINQLGSRHAACNTSSTRTPALLSLERTKPRHSQPKLRMPNRSIHSIKFPTSTTRHPRFLPPWFSRLHSCQKERKPPLPRPATQRCSPQTTNNKTTHLPQTSTLRLPSLSRLLRAPRNASPQNKKEKPNRPSRRVSNEQEPGSARSWCFEQVKVGHAKPCRCRLSVPIHETRRSYPSWPLQRSPNIQYRTFGPPLLFTLRPGLT
jgi:hypothetical protein